MTTTPGARTAGSLRVVIADDDPLVRASLSALLADEPDFEVVGAASDGRAAVDLAVEHEPDLLTVDVQMPFGGPPLVRELTALSHRPVVVGLSANADVATWTSMLAAGASGYLRKGELSSDLASLLRRCARGDLVLSVPGAAALVRELLLRQR